MVKVKEFYLAFSVFITLWASNECKDNSLKINVIKNSKGIKFPYRVSNFKANWYEAEETCRANKMGLAIVKGKHASKTIADTLEHVTDSGSSGQFWTSGNDLAELGNFYWMSTGEKITKHMNWLRGEPTKEERSYKNWQISPHCIYLTRVKTKYLWNYSPCSQRRYFICEHFEPKRSADFD